MIEYVIHATDLNAKIRRESDRMNGVQKRRRKPRVVALVYDGLCTFEYGIVSEVFGLFRPEVGGNLYRFSSVALEKQPVRAAGGLMVRATGKREDLEKADIVVIPGWRGKDESVPTKIRTSIQEAHLRGARLVSICSGIYVLGAAGVLAGRSVTTHWRYASHFSTKFADVVVQPNALYVDEGDIITSAGSSAGIDACLHIVRGDYGAKIANSVARRLVMHSHRHGGQAQFIEQPRPKSGTSHRLSLLMDKLRASIAEPHQIASMANQAGMSARTFQRQFFALNGMPVVQWLTKERVAQACVLLETTDLGVDSISQSVGFGTAEAMRYHFRKLLQVSPIEYRSHFAGSAHG